MRSLTPAKLLLFIFLIGFLIAFVQVGLLAIAFDKLGLSPNSAYLLLMTSLFGSVVNLPLFRIPAEPPRPGDYPPIRQLLQIPQPPFTGYTIIAINVGGGLIPICFSIYLLTHNPLPLSDALLGIIVVSGISYAISRPIPGLGVGMPIFVAPISAALLALLLNPEYSAPLAYISGTMGVLIGADVLRLGKVGTLGLPIASIGGAGTFDGIFITGIVAVLLA
jgi:uncharacterized membrane protein